jgi:anhydro-N-acetylmuramic acid kinase
MTTAVLLPASDRIADVAGFECGPGTRLLDDLALLGTRGREAFDPNGTLAVQGRCADELLEYWLAEPVRRRPQHPAPRTMFSSSFLAATFETARTTGRTLNDLLCTATHFIARSIGRSCRRWLPAPTTRRRVLLSGGGTRNGFLAKLVAEQFDGEPVERLESPRQAAAAAVLAALTLDGVAANLPLVTGASGGRLIGRLTPGDTRNWAACCAWMTSRLFDYPAVGRVA